MSTIFAKFSVCVTLTVLLLAVLPTAGCVASHKGLVEASAGHEDAAQLRTATGRTFALRSTEEAELLRALEGCTIQATGPMVAGSMVVQEWTVIEAGDGSAPYIGLLRQHGSNLVIDDRNSGMPLVLDEASAARLARHAGKVVMISGYVVGAQLLHAVNFRILIE